MTALHPITGEALTDRDGFSLAEQAEAVKTVWLNQKATLANLRGNPKQPAWKAEVIEDRLPKLRAAAVTLNDLAQKEERQ